MARQTALNLPTDVFIAQADALFNALSAPQNIKAVAELDAQGFDSRSFMTKFLDTLNEAKDVEAEQERAKDDWLRELKEDEALAKQGFLWVRRLQARGRVHLSKVEEDTIDLAGQLRFGHLPAPRVRGVTYEMRILLPEAREHLSLLSSVGLTEAFIREGEQILGDLGVEVKETAEVAARRKALTRRVRKVELELTRLFGQVQAADEAASLERESGETAFTLDVIAAELGRREAAAAAKSVTTPATEVA